MQKIFFALLALFIVAYPTAITAQSNNTTANYKITRPASSIFRVVGLEKGLKQGSMGYGYGECFEAAIKEIVLEWEIILIVPITNKYGNGSLTGEIFIIVGDHR